MALFNDDLLFIHIPKTGGTAAKQYLWTHCTGLVGQRPAHARSGRQPEREGPFPIGHIPLRDVERFSGRAPESFERIVAIVRDPYDQQLSQYLFWQDRYKRGGSHYHDLMAATKGTLTEWLIDSAACDFHVWYEETIGGTRKTTADEDGHLDFGSYYRYWLAVDGEVPDNVEVVRFERLSEEFPRAVAPYVQGQPEPMPHTNRGPRRGTARDYYTPLGAQLVERKFGWAFEHYYERWEW